MNKHIVQEIKNWLKQEIDFDQIKVFRELTEYERGRHEQSNHIIKKLEEILSPNSPQGEETWHPRFKHQDSDSFVFQVDDGDKRGWWFYAYRDGDSKNQHSKLFQTKSEAMKEYNLLPLFTTQSLQPCNDYGTKCPICDRRIEGTWVSPELFELSKEEVVIKTEYKVVEIDKSLKEKREEVIHYN